MIKRTRQNHFEIYIANFFINILHANEVEFRDATVK